MYPLKYLAYPYVFEDAIEKKVKDGGKQSSGRERVYIMCPGHTGVQVFPRPILPTRLALARLHTC